jgi:hypothetical protein
VRAFVLESFPGAVEQVKPGWKAIMFGTGEKIYEQVVVVHPERSYINLGFSKGAELADPDGLLEGSGKSIRHVKITDSAVLKSKSLGALLKRAIAAGGMGRDRRKGKS